MKKLAIGLCALVLLVIIGLLIAPLFLSPNDFKQEIQTKFKEKTGLELSLTGNIELSLFPTPKASVDEISVSNKSRILTTVKNITAYPKLGELFSGNFIVDSLEVNEPKLVVEKAGGQYNWQRSSDSSAQAEGDKIVDAAKSATNLSINAIKINKGYFEYRDKDKDKDKSYIAKDLEATASLKSLNGPLDFSANANFMDEKVSLKGKADNFAAPEVSLEGSFMGSNLSWIGGTEAGKLIIDTKDIGPITKKFALDDIAYMAAKPINVSANVSKTGESIELKDIELQVADTTGGGKVIIIPSEESLDVSADMKFKNLGLKDLIPPQTEPTGVEKTESKKEFRESINQKRLVANIILDADVVTYGKSALDNVSLMATLDDGNMVVSPLTASMAGTGRMELSGVLNKDSKGRAFDGNITANSDDFRKFLARLGVTTDSIKQGTLKSFAMSSDVYARVGDEAKFNFSKMEMTLDESQYAGSIGMAVDKGVNLDINGAVGQIDLDKYIIKKEKPKEVTLEQKKQENLESKLDFTWLKKLPLSGKTNLAIANIIYDKKNYSSVRLQSEFKPNQIDFGNLSAAAPEIQFAARGGISTSLSRPKLFLEANLGSVRTLDFIKGDNRTEDKDGQLQEKLPANETRWSKVPFDFTPLDEIDADFVINSPMIDHKGLKLDNVSLKGKMVNSKIDLDKFNAGIFGGELTLKGRFGIGAVPAADINFAARDFDLASVAKGLADNERVYQGRMTVTGSFSSAGVHQRAMAENLEGSLTIAGRDIWIKGFDIDAFANQITNINGPEALVPVAKTLTGDSNVTRITSITGGLLCGQGVLKTQNIVANTASAAGTYEGYADLVKWYMDTRAIFKIVLADSKERPGLGIRIFGSISEPKQEKDFDELIAYYSKRFAKGILKIPQKDNAETPQEQLKQELLQKGAEGILKGLAN